MTLCRPQQKIYVSSAAADAQKAPVLPTTNHHNDGSPAQDECLARFPKAGPNKRRTYAGKIPAVSRRFPAWLLNTCLKKKKNSCDEITQRLARAER